MKDAVYVKVDNSDFLRRDILEGALNCTRMIKEFKNLEILRRTKEERIRHLNNVLEHIKKLEEELKKYPFPKVEISTEKNPVKKAEVQVKKHSKEEDILNEEIAEIERRLRNI